MRKIKGFSYDSKKDRDLIRHVNKQPNKSRYIRWYGYAIILLYLTYIFNKILY